MFSLVWGAIMRPERDKAMCNFFQTSSKTPQNGLLAHILPSIDKKMGKKILSSTA